MQRTHMCFVFMHNWFFENVKVNKKIKKKEKEVKQRFYYKYSPTPITKHQTPLLYCSYGLNFFNILVIGLVA